MKWIRIEERLPEDQKKVLSICKSMPNQCYNLLAQEWFRDEIYTARYEDNEFIILPHGPQFEATHWMELPNPPEEK